MRALVFVSVLVSALTLVSGSGNASDTQPRRMASNSDGDKVQQADPNLENYRGYSFVLAGVADRQDFVAVVYGLRHQIDIVESVGLSPRVLEFFRTVPIVVDELACMSSMRSDPNSQTDKKPGLAAACYGPTVPEGLLSKPRDVSVWNKKDWQWSSTDPIAQAEGNRIGVVMVRARTLDPRHPVLLHEMLHAYHAKIVPQGFGNTAIKFYYDAAKGLYPADAYVMKNEKEFFAVTASVFLSGKADSGIVPSDIEKLPDYSKFLGWLFEVTPPKSGTPIASAN